MPNVYLIVRLNATLPFEAATPKKYDPKKPSIRAMDITATDLPADHVDDTPNHIFQRYETTEPSTYNTYTVACEVFNPGGIKLELSMITMDRAKALYTLNQVPDFVKESDEIRLEHYADGAQVKSKSIVRFEGETCIKIRVGERCVLWYELLTIECEEVIEEDGADEAGGRKRVKMPLPMRGGKGKVQKEHEYADVDVDVEG
jgi:hypothetical protein